MQQKIPSTLRAHQHSLSLYAWS